MHKLEELIPRYLQLFSANGISTESIDYIEKNLGILFPKDCKEILKVFNGDEELANQCFFSFNPSIDEWNIIDKTKYYRQSDCHLPSQFIALREENENFIVMQTQNDAKLPTPIIWTDLNGAYAFQEGLIPSENSLIFPSFTDFFEYLVNEEEKLRAAI